MNAHTQAVMPGIERVMEWKKRKFEGDEESEAKRPRFNFYIRLESESSMPSEEDTESIDSVQDKETDVVRDTSDTDTNSEVSDLEVEVEYEVASLSEDDNFPDYASSGPEDLRLGEDALAAVLYDSSLEKWATDGETSDTSSMEEISFELMDVRKDFGTCVQCKSENNNPLYRYCGKCFQLRCWQCKTTKNYKCFPLCESCFKVRKQLFPPRPRGNRKRRMDRKQPPKVKLDTLQSCLKSLSQDSGIGESQELPQLELNKIVVPEHLKRPSVPLTEQSTDSCNEEDEPPAKTRKVEEKQSSKLDSEGSSCGKSISAGSDVATNSHSEGSLLTSEGEQKSDSSDLCMICNTNPKNGIFVHSVIAHICCCYSCAVEAWRTCKRCPVCNGKVEKILKSYTV